MRANPKTGGEYKQKNREENKDQKVKALADVHSLVRKGSERNCPS